MSTKWLKIIKITRKLFIFARARDQFVPYRPQSGQSIGIFRPKSIGWNGKTLAGASRGLERLNVNEMLNAGKLCLKNAAQAK
jgi:hypothetical protein